jgi:hypothetical protein
MRLKRLSQTLNTNITLINTSNAPYRDLIAFVWTHPTQKKSEEDKANFEKVETLQVEDTWTNERHLRVLKVGWQVVSQ